jgi:flagellar FliJ protein
MAEDSPLPIVIEIARKNRDSVARSAATAQRLVDENLAQLASLERYRADYLARGASASESDVAALVNFQAFMGRLELAIGQQRAAVEHHRARVASLKDEYLRASVKVKSLETLAASREAEGRRAAARLERKVEDEQVSRAIRYGTVLGPVH